MARKKHHMTKHEYEEYIAKNRYIHSIDNEKEGNRSLKSSAVKYRERSDSEIKKRLQGIHCYTDDIQKDE